MSTAVIESPKAAARPTARASAGHRSEGPPIPHEHGAWVILYAPLVLGLMIERPTSAIPAILLVLAVTGAYLARHAAALLIRKRGDSRTAAWLGVYTAAAAAGGLPLLFGYHRVMLLAVGGLCGVVFGLHSALMVLPGRRRMDRSQWGEILGVGALCLTGPAGVVAARGSFTADAWMLWLCCVLFFSSAVFNVKMLLSAAKVKEEFNTRLRLQLGRDNLAYHALLILAVATLAALRGPVSGAVLAAGYLPILVRAFRNTAGLSRKLPPLKKVGMIETGYALWFTACFIASHAIQGPHL